MEPEQKKILRPLCLELRHLLEGYYDSDGAWHGGDLEQRLASLGVWWERDPMPLEKLPNLSAEDRRARELVDAYLALRAEAGVSRKEAVEEFVRETAYTWATRLLLLRCMEARGLIDEVVVAKEVYGGRSLAQMRLCRDQPALCTGEDGGLFPTLAAAFAEHARRLPEVFDPAAPGVALRPSTAALQRCVALLSGTAPVSGRQTADDEVFSAPDALGWAYQYWNAEEKDRVFERVRTVKGAKITGAEIVPATQLYTEPYMVKFLVQNSLGAYWQQFHPDSDLADGWEFYVRDADRAPVKAKNVESMTFLDPACGSGHFLLEAFDLFYQMYLAEGRVTEPEQVCRRILEKNLYGIDIDERAAQIARAALWMKAAEKVQGYRFAPKNLVATNLRLPPGKDHLETFLAAHPEDAELADALKAVLDGLAHADELGSLVQIEEPVKRAFSAMKVKRQTTFAAHGGDGAAWYTPPKTLEEWDAWQGGVVQRLADHFAAEAERATPAEAFFSRSAGQGLRLFDLLSRRYDVVAANPPYMGSGNMGPIVKQYVDQNYPRGKRDLYGAFILRNLQLSKPSGKVGMVTQQSWMFLSRYQDLRIGNNNRSNSPGDVNGVIGGSSIETIAHLGPRAFGEIGGAIVNVVLFVLSNLPASTSHNITSFRIISPNTPAEKDKLLRSTISDNQHPNRYYTSQSELKNIYGSPVAYWLAEEYLRLFEELPPVKEYALVREGLHTTDNNRYLRCFWEVSGSNDRWIPYIKGGGYKRWSGLEWLTVDWEGDGTRIRSMKAPVIPSYDLYFKHNFTYTDIANGVMGVRYFPSGRIFDAKGPVISLIDRSSGGCASILNSRIATYLLRALSPNLQFRTGYVNNIPIPSNFNRLSVIENVIIPLSLSLTEQSILESCFALQREKQPQNTIRACYLCLFESTIENITSILYDLSQSAINNCLAETGTPAGFFPLIASHDALPPFPDDLPPLPAEVLEYLAVHERIAPPPDELARIRARLRQLYEAGPGATVECAEEPAAGEGDEEAVVVGARIPIPPETFLEELSQKMELHPITVYHLLRDGIEREGWRCLPEERRVLADRYTVIVLRLLGHRWPKQVEAGEPMPDWADTDGIIPLVADGGGRMLLELVRERIVADGEDVHKAERYFEEVMGMPLGAWLSTAFFKHHTKQFKKRPVAWQLQSGPFTRRNTPAFACLLYCQAVDGDILHKVRTRYVGELRKRCETELRDIEGLTLRTEAQDRRARELTDRLAELRAFDAKLAEVAERGFTSAALDKIAKKEPLDQWCSPDGVRPSPATLEAFLQQEGAYTPDVNDGVRVNVAPLQKAGLLAGDVIAKKDVEKAIADRAEWRADERRWCREGKLPKCGWWS